VIGSSEILREQAGYNAAETAATTARLFLTAAVMSQSKKPQDSGNHAAFY
jgi:hypothetical protein